MRIPEQLKRPPRFASLNAYVMAECRNADRIRSILSAGKWPCMSCEGMTTIYDPNDPGCPIEGDKMRNRIVCPTCGGRGVGTKAEWQQRRTHHIRLWQERRHVHEKVRALISAALDKLTVEEAAALGWEKR